MDQVKFVEDCLKRLYRFKFFKGCLPQILLGPFLNNLTHLLIFYAAVTTSPGFLIHWRIFFWSNHRRCFVKKTVLKNFAIFTGEHLCWSVFLIKLLVFSPATLIKRNSDTGVFLWILRIFKSTYLEKHLQMIAFTFRMMFNLLKPMFNALGLLTYFIPLVFFCTP